MSDRMMVAEVVAELRRQANQSATRAQAAANLPTDAARIYGVWCDAYIAAAYLVEQHLTPQVLDEQKSRDRQALELLVNSVVLNTRGHETMTTGQLFFAASKIRLMAEEVAKLCEIETEATK